MKVGRGSRVQRLAGGQEKQGQYRPYQEDELQRVGGATKGKHITGSNNQLSLCFTRSQFKTYLYKKEFLEEGEVISWKIQAGGPWNVNVTRLGIRDHEE